MSSMYSIREIKESAMAYANEDIDIKDTYIYNRKVSVYNFKLFLDSYIMTKRKHGAHIFLSEIGLMVGKTSNAGELIDHAISFISQRISCGMPSVGNYDDIIKWYHASKDSTDNNINSIW